MVASRAGPSGLRACCCPTATSAPRACLSTAGFIDPGFTSHVTLELSNVANLPITLYAGMPVGQMCFVRLSSPAESPYGSATTRSKYQGQRGPTPSQYWRNFT